MKNSDSGALPRKKAEKLVKKLLKRERTSVLLRSLMDEARNDPVAFSEFVLMFLEQYEMVKSKRLHT